MRTWLLLSFALLPFTLFACAKTAEDPNRLTVSGHVEATDVRISTKVGGRLEHFDVQEGDAVTAGQELAQIETVDVELAIAQSRAQRAAAEAERFDGDVSVASAVGSTALRPATLEKLVENDEIQAQRGLVALMSGGTTTYKALEDLQPEDMPARIAANRLRTAWLKERGDEWLARGEIH